LTCTENVVAIGLSKVTPAMISKQPQTSVAKAVLLAAGIDITALGGDPGNPVTADQVIEVLETVTSNAKKVFKHPSARQTGFGDGGK
jgi:hypothetical protein